MLRFFLFLKAIFHVNVLGYGAITENRTSCFLGSSKSTVNDLMLNVKFGRANPEEWAKTLKVS